MLSASLNKTFPSFLRILTYSVNYCHNSVWDLSGILILLVAKVSFLFWAGRFYVRILVYWPCHQSSHCTPSTAWYQGISTIPRDVIDEATSNLTFTLGTSVSTLATSELATCTLLMRAGSSYSELMAGLTDVQEIEQLRAVFRRLYRLVVDLRWFGVVSVANSGQTLLSLTEILPHTVTSTRFYVPPCNTNVYSCFNRTMPDITQLVWCNSSSPQTTSMFSHDLSPIEHLWDHLGQQIRRRPYPPMNRNQLVQALRQEWRAIPDAVIRRLTNCVRRRVRACILAHGGHTRYSGKTLFTFVMSRPVWNHTFHPQCCCELWWVL